MRLLPRIENQLYADKSGRLWVSACVSWWKWTWGHKMARCGHQFWPASMPDTPVFFAPADLPEPTPADSKAASEILEDARFQSLERFYNAQQTSIEHACLTEPKDYRYWQGLRQGFLLARQIPRQIVEYPQRKAVSEMTSVEAGFFENMQRMDSQLM